MSKKLDELIKALSEKEGEDIHEYIAKAFNMLGFKAWEIKETDVEPDVLAVADSSKYMLIIESCVVGGNKSPPANKTGQLRQSGARYKKQYQEKGYEAYYVIVGRPRFSDSIIKASEPDVSLMSILNLVNLLRNNITDFYTLDDMEILFQNPGLLDNSLDYLFKQYRSSFLVFGFTLAIIQKEFRKKDKININNLIIAIKTICDTIIPSYDITKEEIEEAIYFLGSNTINIFSIEKSDKNWFLSRKSHLFDKHLPKVLGKNGKKMIDKYNYCRDIIDRIKKID